MKEKKTMSRQMWIRLSIVLAVLVLAVTLTLVLIMTYGSKKPNTPGSEPGKDPVNIVTYRSPSSLSVDAKGNVYVSDATANVVTKLDAKGKELSTRLLSGSVQRVLVDGDSVYALVGELAGELVVMDANLTVKKTIEVGHTPTDIVVKGKVAYVANRFDNTVSIVDLSGGKVTATVEVGREPIAMTLSGNDLYIANHLSSAASNAETVAATVTVLDTAKNTVKTTIELTDGATGVRGITASSDGEYVFVTHLVARYMYPTTQLDRGWINSNAFSVIETKTNKSYAILLDEVEVGASNPWDIEMSENGETLYVSLSGTHEIMTINMARLLSYIDTQIEGGDDIVNGKQDIVNHINFLAALSGTQNRQKRYAVSGNGARDIELVGETLYVAQYFTGTIDVMNFEKKNEVTTTTFTIGKQAEETSERLGEMIWYDARFCYQKWESCASCHPDARADSLNWDNLNDGLGNPKNTKSMLFSHRTPPVMITGARVDAETAVGKGMLFIQFNVLGDDMLGAIDDYLRSLLPVESPYLNRDGTLTEAAKRGKKLFETAGCATCHPAPIYTDLQFHTSPYLGSDGTWENRDFVTPTLVEIWRSYPWIYNGGVTSMEDIIRKFAPDLKDNEVADLAEFVLSIGIVDEKLGVEQVFGTDKDGGKLTCKVKPGATLNTVTVRNQTKGKTQGATVTVTLYDADKKALVTNKLETGNLAYGQLAKLELTDFKVPDTITNGSYLEITITAADGSSLATAYRLNCEVE